MRVSTFITTVAALTLGLLSASGVQAQPKPVPWDGRGTGVTVPTLDSKFMLHILKQRYGADGKGDPAAYVGVEANGRSPAFNKDSGVIDIAVDDKAIFNTQMNFRRTELVQNIQAATSGTTFFRASIQAKTAIVNKHKWQVFFPETHLWEVFVDASLEPPQIQFLTENKVQWKADFKTKTWYNFGIAVEKKGISLYTSEGDAALKQAFSDGKALTPPSDYELHFGMLTLSTDGGEPKMTGKDTLSFNGVSVESAVDIAGGGGAGSGGGSGGVSPAPAPGPTTTAPVGPAPGPTSQTPSTTAPAPSKSGCKSKRRRLQVGY